jgi:hypothetical protein
MAKPPDLLIITDGLYILHLQMHLLEHFTGMYHTKAKADAYITVDTVPF